MNFDANLSSADCRVAWARDQLDAADSDAAGEIRERWYKLLESEEFVPPEEHDEAFRILDAHGRSSRQPDIRPGFLHGEEKRLQHLVEVFAAQMFDLTPEERRSRWDELREQCKFFVIPSARLSYLKTGLEARRPSDVSMNANELANHLFACFPLPRPERALARQRFLEKSASQQGRSARAARWVKRHCPEIANLDPDLVDSVALPGHANRKMKVARLLSVVCSVCKSPNQRAARVALFFGFAVACVAHGLLAEWMKDPNKHSSPRKYEQNYEQPHFTKPTAENVPTMFDMPDAALYDYGGSLSLIMFGLDEARQRYRARLGLDSEANGRDLDPQLRARILVQVLQEAKK